MKQCRSHYENAKESGRRRCHPSSTTKSIFLDFWRVGFHPDRQGVTPNENCYRKHGQLFRKPLTSLAATLTLLTLIGPLLPPAASAAHPLKNATLHFKPAAPFVGQPFQAVVEVTVTPGVELEDFEIGGLPDSSRATFTNLKRAGRKTQRGRGDAVDILRYTADGRGSVPFTGSFACSLRGLAVERISAAFFSHTRSVTVAIRTAAANLTVRNLPQAGRPADFSGAIGRFTLSGSAKPLTVTPDDLVTLLYTLSGSGWLADATLVTPDLGPDFKTYPVQGSARNENPPRIVLSQVVIPLSTNATVIAPPRFTFFDPDAAAYRTATLEPFHLTFAKPTLTEEPAVRRIDASTVTHAIEAADAPLPPELALAETVAKLRQILPLVAALILAASVVTACYRVRRILAIIMGLLILAAGVAASRWLSHSADARVLEVTTSATARLAPSPQALPLFDLHPGASVTPLEHTPGWVRVRASGREAWVPHTCLTAR